MNRLLLSLCAVLAALRRPLTGRDQAIATLSGVVKVFDHTLNPDGDLKAFELFDDALTLCRRYQLHGPEFGVGDLEHFSRMGERALESAIAKAQSAGVTLALGTQEKVQQFRLWRELQRRLQSEASKTTTLIDAMPAHA